MWQDHLIGNLAEQITDHNVASDAHQPKFDAQAADIRNVRKQIAFDNALQDFSDTGYADGFMLDCTEASDIDGDLSSGYVHNAVKGVFRSIDPALDGGVKQYDLSLAEQEDIKGNAAVLTVDTPNASGHFDVAASGKIQPGCRIQIQGEGVVRIMGVTGDGTAPDSVTILGAIPAGVFDLVGIYGTEGVSALTLSGVVDGAAVISGGHYSSYIPENAIDGNSSTDRKSVV